MHGILVRVMALILDCLVIRNWLILIMGSRIQESTFSLTTMLQDLNTCLQAQQDSLLKDFIKGIKIIQ